MKMKNAQFVISVADFNMIHQHDAPEIAIAGKSNVGKSSFINMLTNVKKLAKTSGEPGRTRLLNYFDINNGELMLVDLPGYGYARVPHGEQDKWASLIQGYLSTGPNLINVFMLVDIRHEPSPLDIQLMSYLYHYNIPFTVIATKGDKLSKVQLVKAKQVVANALSLTPSSIYVTSALKKTGVQEVLDRITELMDGAIVSDEAIAEFTREEYEEEIIAKEKSAAVKAEAAAKAAAKAAESKYYPSNTKKKSNKRSNSKSKK